MVWAWSKREARQSLCSAALGFQSVGYFFLKHYEFKFEFKMFAPGDLGDIEQVYRAFLKHQGDEGGKKLSPTS